jgi:hypothetical protein
MQKYSNAASMLEAIAQQGESLVREKLGPLIGAFPYG